MKNTQSPLSTVHLDQVVPAAELSAAIDAGLVRVQRHPVLPLRIFNYSELAVYSRTWNAATTACRGLIADDEGNVLGRPWPKFFNHGEMAGAELDLQAPVEVTDKADGSLAILYPAAGKYAIATRGSFASEQAEHATAVYWRRYASAWEPVEGWTYLFEIIYPANRIVLDYGSLDDLVLLGAVEIATGFAVGPLDQVCEGWPGPRIAVHPHSTLAEALAAEPRPNAEGLVVRYLTGSGLGSGLAGTMVKLKQADYLVMHRIVTGLTSRRLWERSAAHAVAVAEPGTPVRRIGQLLHLDPTDVQEILATGPDWLDEVRASVPQEFLDWIDQTTAQHAAQVADVLAEVQAAVAGLAGLERKDVAARISSHRYRGMIFSALDGRPVLAQAWSSVRPPAERAFGARGEDVA